MENQNHARKLPVFTIEGTDFYVDTRLNEFREVDAPWNRISMYELSEGEGGLSGLVYDTLKKNVYEEIIDPDNIPPHVRLVIVPPLKELDPVGLARAYGLPDNEFTHKKGKRI
ncbi:hypothetical protein BDD43_0820 [Mucilaginibacter gracilis]|uniref:Uncharacterized protein n=1 Tax=Mucilaginibacter gracilis TaxID=423350 RepID=A0A495IXA8_9SPHI|nr:hypothetical protein [Mucilaginibacter gracilis]RKR80688.1 hypothetical protein BDD43_0820 [Mucilaginibacter gracilis]